MTSILELRFQIPPDGLPCAKDWLTLWESIISAGVDLVREPLSVNVLRLGV